MDYNSTKEEMLSDAQRLLDCAEVLICRCRSLEEQNKSGGNALWIMFDESVEEQRPKDGELVVVQVGNAQPYMFTYLKGCKLKINKWLRIPEWKEVI